MTTTFTRRHLLQGSMGAAAFGLLSSVGAAPIGAQPVTTRLTVGARMIEVKRRSARMFGITQDSGRHGLVFNSGERFRVKLQNRIADQTVIHWHGLTPPYNQDGVAPISQPLVAAGADYDYDFPLERPGTNWMHSHHGLQEQQLLAAPLIVRDPAEAGRDEQEVVVILHDFTFRDPIEILTELQRGARSAPHDMGAMQAGSRGGGMANMPGMNMGTRPAPGAMAQRGAPT
jgi:FtsP/CotA-like multicopper oxidase with cupredoxin domain